MCITDSAVRFSSVRSARTRRDVSVRNNFLEADFLRHYYTHAEDTNYLYYRRNVNVIRCFILADCVCKGVFVANRHRYRVMFTIQKW